MKRLKIFSLTILTLSLSSGLRAGENCADFFTQEMFQFGWPDLAPTLKVKQSGQMNTIAAAPGGLTCDYYSPAEPGRPHLTVMIHKNFKAGDGEAYVEPLRRDFGSDVKLIEQGSPVGALTYVGTPLAHKASKKYQTVYSKLKTNRVPWDTASVLIFLIVRVIM